MQNVMRNKYMSDKYGANYHKIEKAIIYIRENFKKQPALEDIAAAANSSPFHFQRSFKEWAGVSPKKFTQFLSLEYAKGLLNEQKMNVLDVAYAAGLSSPGRLHDLFVKLEGMTPGEYKNGGLDLQINYSFSESLFGKLIIASTLKGVCYIAFIGDEALALINLKKRFPNAEFLMFVDPHQENVLKIFQNNWKDLDEIKLHLHGTSFQLKVWESLLKIPSGCLVSYGDIARYMDKPKASRAVGTAIGLNPIAYLIPCHRVIKQNGDIGEYMWGAARKSAIIGWEAAERRE